MSRVFVARHRRQTHETTVPRIAHGDINDRQTTHGEALIHKPSSGRLVAVYLRVRTSVKEQTLVMDYPPLVDVDAAKTRLRPTGLNNWILNKMSQRSPRDKVRTRQRGHDTFIGGQTYGSQ